MEVSVTVPVQTKNTMAVGETDRVPVQPGNRQERIENMANIISDETIEYVGILAKLELSQEEAEAAKKDMVADILLEVNVAKEESKYGFFLEDTEAAIREIAKFPHVRIKGLMTIAPFVENPEENREVFKKLYEFAVDIGKKNIDNVTMNVLSMGMTGDYQTAIEEGATMVRVGTGIFGTRAKIGEK